VSEPAVEAPAGIDLSQEHYDVELVDADGLTPRKGAKKYLGFIPELCIVCGACVDHCPWHCLFMVDASAVEGEPAASVVDDAIKEDKPHVIFWVDDLECTRCNVCVERCPTNAITMDKVVGATGSRRRHLGTT
jgi:NAD-dependent dihydropyrimidine dehydrogenase PreA subunit